MFSILRSFTQNHCIVKRNYEMYGANRADRSNLSDLEKQLPRPVYDGDEDNDSSKEASLFFCLLIITAELDNIATLKWKNQLMSMKSAQ